MLPGGGAASFQVARGATLVLSATDGVAIANGRVDPAAGMTVTQMGSDLTLVVAGDAATGIRQVLAEDASDSTHLARRTIEVV